MIDDIIHYIDLVEALRTDTHKLWVTARTASSVPDRADRKRPADGLTFLDALRIDEWAPIVCIDRVAHLIRRFAEDFAYDFERVNPQ